MGFNYGYEKKKFDAKWKKLHAEYIEAGMCEADIQTLYDLDWDEVRSDRRYYSRTQPLGGAVFADDDEDAGEDQSPLLKKFSEQISSMQPEIIEWGRYAWVEDIDDPELARQLKSLSETDREFISYLLIDGLSRAEIARKLNISRAAVTKRINRIKKYLKNI